MNIREFVKSIINLIYPQSIYCIACNNIIDETRNYSLCDDCFERFKWIGSRTCNKCGKILSENNPTNICYDCKNNRHEFHRGYSCVQYGSLEKSIVFKLKYNKKTYISRVIAEIMNDRMLIEDLDYDIVIPVPINKKRKRKRGYNQAELIAGYFSDFQGTKCDNKCLVRLKNTEPLKSMSPTERKESLLNAFNITEHGRKMIYGKRVLVIDDIYTTGATMDSVCLTLKREGAEKVYFLVFASGGDYIIQ